MIEAIYAASLTKRATLVIFYLINRANQELTCFPSVGSIASECNMSSRTVQRALNDLEEAGFLERESRFHERGGQRSSLFRLRFSEVGQRAEKMEEIDFVNHMEELNDVRKEEAAYYVKPEVSKVIIDEVEITSKHESIEEKSKMKLKNTLIYYALNTFKKRLFKIVSWGLCQVFIP